MLLRKCKITRILPPMSNDDDYKSERMMPELEALQTLANALKLAQEIDKQVAEEPLHVVLAALQVLIAQVAVQMEVSEKDLMLSCITNIPKFHAKWIALHQEEQQQQQAEQKKNENNVVGIFERRRK